jgi:hypothetical protein
MRIKEDKDKTFAFLRSVSEKNGLLYWGPEYLLSVEPRTIECNVCVTKEETGTLHFRSKDLSDSL